MATIIVTVMIMIKITILMVTIRVNSKIIRIHRIMIEINVLQ